MQKENLIPANEFCLHHNIEVSFINSLQDYGLIECIIIDDNPFIAASQLTELEKLLRFYYDLDINLEGIDVIIHLLNRLKSMQEEMAVLKNRLRLYETIE